MAKVSVIIPVYNTGKYIEKCLTSLANQTRNINLEIIIINDGSTDNTDELVKQSIEKHIGNLDIKYYTKENEGVAKTRNFGIEKATSNYIMFVDSDDYIDLKTFEILEKYINDDIDLIKFKLQKVDKNDNIIEKTDGPIFNKISGQEAFNKLYCEDILLDSPCVYVIKKNLFVENNFKFQRTYHEDFGLIPFIIIVAKTVTSIDEYLYKYVQAPDSITRNEDYNKTIQKMEDVLFHYDNMIKLVQNMNLEKTTKENIKIYYTNAIVLKLQELKEDEIRRYIKEIQKRKMYKNIKTRNLKQLLKRLLLKYNIKLYLKLR